MEQKTYVPFYKKWRIWARIVSAVLASGVILYLLGSSSHLAQKSSLDDIYQKVADDAVSKYEIAERQGDKIQTCVQAMQVSAAYLQAQNESSYRNWKDIEKTACARAGIPQ